ncbi:ROK family protein [Actinoplanes xinjiangensis]|uniref:Putative NBD/HSP70 family sugar kinase n=1 Tax=Actinoplanes xinjiangensis TaxID=512350 RepID=A0A316F9T6_9ACTN|nr:ROK family protein [Actinoplanes xinjiangensis]PWK43474.1 putative NBD/HSP70 family sugar kinase [Actinoplanes xinjiangensis]GIF41790.1 xylose repressor [Actinoplanes xinjiangensis]
MTTSADLRIHNLVRLLRAVHDADEPLTRAGVARLLGIGRNTAAALVGELEAAALLHEVPAGATGRGRPTTSLLPHPDGPVAIAADLREDTWTLARIEVGGRLTELASGEHDRTPAVFAEIRAATRRHAGDRLAALGVAVAGPVRHGRRLHISHLDWDDVDLAEHVGDEWPTTVDNDARLAGLAEARRGALRGAGTALHFHIDFDIGGTLLLGGDAQRGAGNIAGEFGHMPLTGSPLWCRCGVQGCWSLQVGTNALLRHVGQEAGHGRGREAGREILARAEAGDARAGRAVDDNAAALGHGLGALANALDPEVITLSGLGVELLRLRRDLIERSCAEKLMRFRRAEPPSILAGTVGEASPLRGAAELAFDTILTPAWLQARLPARPPAGASARASMTARRP